MTNMHLTDGLAECIIIQPKQDVYTRIVFLTDIYQIRKHFKHYHEREIYSSFKKLEKLDCGKTVSELLILKKRS